MRWAFAVAFIAVLCAVLMQEFAAAESGTQQAVTSASSQAQQYSVAGQVLGADGIAVGGGEYVGRAGDAPRLNAQPALVGSLGQQREEIRVRRQR